MADVIHVRSEGGVVIPMTLPLHPDIAKRLERGRIHRVHPDGTTWRETPTDDVPSLPTERPALAASKAAWVGWAVANGMPSDDAEAATKSDLIDRFGTSPALTEGE